VVTLVMALRRDMAWSHAALYVVVQVVAAVPGVMLAHLMFELPLIAASGKIRAGGGQFIAEMVATMALLLTILRCAKTRPEAVPYAVGLVITAGYWYTASTSFANPAVTIARSLTESFAGIRLADVPPFILAQILGALLAWALYRWLLRPAPNR
jgi:glycerol uptake facilitator-like aquaporin